MKVCLFFSCDHDIRQQTQRLLCGVCVCVSLWYAHTKLYTLLDVVMYVFLLLLRRLSCALGRCVGPSIHSSVCLSFSQSTTKPTSIIKVYYFSSFFCFCLFICIRSLTRLLFFLFFACLCFFRGLYMDFITFKSRKNQQAIPNNKNKNKKRALL